MAAQQSLKEFLIEKTAEELSQPPLLVTDVLRWVFKDVTKAVKIYEEIEISGWGKFLISQNKLRKRIQRMEQMKGRMEALPQTEEMMEKLSWAAEDLQFYYSKLKPTSNETKQEDILSGVGRMAQSDIPSGQTKGTDSNSGERTTSDM
jgi:nucleoid DNA-binding protein